MVPNIRTCRRSGCSPSFSFSSRRVCLAVQRSRRFEALSKGGKSWGVRLRSVLSDAIISAWIAFFLFCLTLGVRTVDNVQGLTLIPRPGLLAIAVGIVFFGRLLLNLFVWQADYPLTLPFSKLYTREPLERRDRWVLGLTGLIAAVLGSGSVLLASLLPSAKPAALGVRLLAIGILTFEVIGLLRRLVVHFFPNLPYARIFTVTALVFAVAFPLTSYVVEKTFHLGLPLRYLFDLSILVLTYVMLGWGLNIVVGLAGLLDLGYVAFYAVGAYTFALLGTTFGWSFWVCLPLAGLLAGLWGVMLGFPVLRLRGDYLAIVTLAFGEIVRIILLNWTSLTNGPNGISDIPKPTFFGLPFKTGEGGFAAFFGLKHDHLYAVIFLYYVILLL